MHTISRQYCWSVSETAFLYSRCTYSPNTTATYNPVVVSLILVQCGDIETQRGPTLRSIERSAVERPSSTLQSESHNSVHKTKSIWFTCLNCRSLLPNIDELRLIFEQNRPFIITITETWLNETVFDDEIYIAEFTVLRQDRQVRRVGGCAVYVADGFKFQRRTDLEESVFEVRWLEIKIHNSSYVFGCAYRPPDFSENEFFNYLDDVITSETCAGKEVILTGDFNCNFMDKSLPQIQRALEFLDSNGLTQLISNSTRQSQTSTSLLDIIVTSTPEIFLRTGVLQNSLSDHRPIYDVVPGLLRRHQHRVITSRRWNEEKVDSFQTDMNKISWSDLNTPENIDKKLEMVTVFYK